MWKKTKAMEISKKPSPFQIITDQKQLKNMKYFSFLDRMITNDSRCTCEINLGLPPGGRLFPLVN
jgi:hypothetical protein